MRQIDWSNTPLSDPLNFLHRVAACAPIIIWSCDNDGVVQFSEGKALQSMGLSDGEIVGLNIFDLYADFPDLLIHVRKALKGETISTSIKVGENHFDSHYSPHVDCKGNIQGVIGIVHDITSWVETENALRESESRALYAQRAGQIGIWEWNILTNDTYWSETIEPMFGVSPGGFKGSYENYLSTIHPDDREIITNAIQEKLENDTPYRVEHRVIWPDGSIHWIYGAGELFRDNDGNPKRMLGIVQDITERVRARNKLIDIQKNLEMAQEMAQIGSWSFDMLNNQVSWSKELYRIYGITPETFEGDLLAYSFQAIHPGDVELVQKLAGDATDDDIDSDLEFRIIRPDGEIRHVWALSHSTKNEDGITIKREGVLQDITEKIHADANLHKLSSALEQTDDLIMITNRDGHIEFVNQALESVTGFSRSELIGNNPSVLRSDKHEEPFFHHMWTQLLAGENFRDTVINCKKDGSIFYEEKTITPLVDDNGNITHFISTGRDITKRVEDQQRMEYLAHHDVLTNLPNRILFSDRLAQAVNRRHNEQEQVALIFIDLDRFKIINDTLGHETGDRFLQALSLRLVGCLRTHDTIARLGGDEFAILLEGVHSSEEVAGIARKILDSLGAPITVDKQDLYVTASLGISIFPSDGSDPQTILKHADTAMYRAKDLGRNSYQFYSSDMSTKAFERLSIETNLRQALERNEFILHFQPQFNTILNRVVGVEALLRWQHPDHGLVSPADFIPILEETGLIIEVGEWVLREACKQAKKWNDQQHFTIRLSVNVSTRQFASTQFYDMVSSALADSGLPPNLLELEITESILLAHSTNIQQSFDALTESQVRIALDDFGTGYSSLSYLKRFPIDVIKIDRSFVRDITTDIEDASIVEAIIALSKSMDLEVLAEGVETQEQQDFLAERNCNVFQGFLYSPAVAAESLQLHEEHTY